MSKIYNRRQFLKVAASAGVVSLVVPTALSLMSSSKDEEIRLTILSTNDVHSRIDPFPAKDKRNAGMAGFARRAAMIKEIRAEEDNVLLFDAGDIFQGTPYFNMYGGELEFKLMSDMGYDAATMGNHDFDNGLEGFNKQLPHAKFPFICSNYDFDKTILKEQTKPYQIFEKSGLKIGVIGVGVEMEGLISKKNYGDAVYLDPIEKANEYAAMLKKQNCDYIICISHLGYNYEQHKQQKKVSDLILAANSRNIDYIIGGHTHTFLDQPDEVLNIDGQKVLVSQSGWGGILLGRLDVVFSKATKDKISLLYTSKKVRSQV